MTDWQELVKFMRDPKTQEAVARYAEPEVPVNMTIDDMEWEAAMVFGYDGWEDDEAEQGELAQAAMREEE